MSVNLDTELDYEPIFRMLLDKTKAGKLKWHETAEEGTYVSAVKGQRTFELGLDRGAGLGAGFAGGFPVVKVKDHEGKNIFETPARASALAHELYTVARRIASRIDEKVESTLELLNGL